MLLRRFYHYKEQQAILPGFGEKMKLIRIEAAFHSETDKAIAERLYAELGKRLQQKQIDGFIYAEAVSSLFSLIPKIMPYGLRQISNTVISSGMEEIIRSRILAAEIDLNAPSTAWGRLSRQARNILREYPLVCELTNSCTGMCDYCPSVRKGAITEKASWNSSVDLLGEFAGIPLAPPACDMLYYDTDPFDLKWDTVEGEKDYRHLKREYDRLNPAGVRRLFTSTSVPIGEELRIIDFIAHQESQVKESNMRISVNEMNSQRVEDMVKVANALSVRGDASKLLGIRIGNVVKRGMKWRISPVPDDLRDIHEVNCMDGVVIGLENVDGVYMVGASEERPSGEVRLPIESADNGQIRYRFPEYYTFSSGVLAIPNCGLVTISRDGQVDRSKINGDPHRSLLRIAMMADFGISRLGVASLFRLRKNLSADLAVIRHYLALGNTNRSMEYVLALFGEQI